MRIFTVLTVNGRALSYFNIEQSILQEEIQEFIDFQSLGSLNAHTDISISQTQNILLDEW